MPEPACIDLRERFGEEYRIELDPAAGERCTDPWMFVMPCRKGAICPHGGDRLGIEVVSKQTRDRLMAIPGAVLWQDGDREWTVLLSVDHFQTIAEIVQPRRRRRLSPEQKAQAAERLSAFKFRPHVSAEKAG